MDTTNTQSLASRAGNIVLSTAGVAAKSLYYGTIAFGTAISLTVFTACSFGGITHGISLTDADDVLVDISNADDNVAFWNRIDEGCTDFDTAEGREECGRATQKAIKNYWKATHSDYSAHQQALPGLSNTFGKTGLFFGEYGDVTEEARQACYVGLANYGDANYKSTHTHSNPEDVRFYAGGHSLIDVAKHCFDGLEAVEETLNVDLGLVDRNDVEAHVLNLAHSYEQPYRQLGVFQQGSAEVVLDCGNGRMGNNGPKAIYC